MYVSSAETWVGFACKQSCKTFFHIALESFCPKPQRIIVKLSIDRDQTMAYTNKYIVIFLLLLLAGCSNMQRKIAYNSQDIESPKLLFDSGILQLHRQIKGPRSDIAETLKLSPDGRYLATTMKISEDLIFWDLKTGRKIRTYKTRSKRSKKLLMSKKIYFYPDNKTVLVSKFHDSYPEAHRNRTLLNLEENTESKIRTGINILNNNLHFSPDGKFIASSQPAVLTNEDKDYGKTSILQLIDAKTWKEVASVKKGYGPADFRFSKDGKYIIDLERVGDERPQLTDDRGRTLDWPSMYEAGMKRDLFRQKHFSPEIRFWSVPDLELVKTFDNVFLISYSPSFDISPDGKSFAATGLLNKEWLEEPELRISGTRIFNLSTGEIVNELPKSFDPLSFSHSGKYLIGGVEKRDSVLKIYDTKELQLREQLVIGVKGVRYHSPIAISDNGKRLAMRLGRELYIWNVVE